LVSAQSGVPQTATLGSMPTSLTAETSNFKETSPPGCTKVMAGCKGSFTTKAHDVAGDVTVIDDCTFRVQGWEFDGGGPAVEWWGAMQNGDTTTFPYSDASMKIGELGPPGKYVVGKRPVLTELRFVISVHDMINSIVRPHSTLASTDATKYIRVDQDASRNVRNQPQS
jgi:hypothetical protein